MRALFAVVWCTVFVLAIPLVAVLLGEGESIYLGETLLLVPWLLVVIGAHLAVLRRVEDRGWRPVLTLAVPYLAAAIAGGGARMLLQLLYERVPGLGEPQDQALLEIGLFGGLSSFGILGVWMLFYVAPRAIEDSRRRERERQELAREAERARVRSTLEPHFVLNTLNAIAGLVSDDPGLARELIGSLGDLLREVVQRSAHDSGSVRDEVAWLRHYARILEVRHAGQLTVAWHLDEAALGCRIPVMLLQPIVENAIQHGALHRPDGGKVEVTVERRANTLRCVITDDGPGIEPAAPHGNGLALTRRRVQHEIVDGQLDVTTGATGTTVTIEMPVLT